jgi:hypothetical protein
MGLTVWIPPRVVLLQIGNIVLPVGIIALLWVHITGAERIADMVAAAGSDPAGVIMAISLLVASDDPLVKHTLAICNANRHVGLAVLLSGQYLRPKESVPAIAVHTVPAPCV